MASVTNGRISDKSHDYQCVSGRWCQRSNQNRPLAMNECLLRGLTHGQLAGQSIVYWSDEDQCYIGQCPELLFGGVHGDDAEAVFRELRQAVEENVILHQQQGTLPEPRHAVA